MSVFAEILESALADLNGAQGAAFVDFECEAIDTVALTKRVGSVRRAEMDMSIVGAHWGVVYLQAVSTCKKLKLGPIQELALHCRDALVLVRRVTEGYFVVLFMAAEGNLGQASRALDRIQSRIAAQM